MKKFTEDQIEACESVKAILLLMEKYYQIGCREPKGLKQVILFFHREIKRLHERERLRTEGTINTQFDNVEKLLSSQGSPVMDFLQSQCQGVDEFLHSELRKTKVKFF